MNDILELYGYTPAVTPDKTGLARVTAVHRERYEIACAEGITHARLKPGIYYNGGGEAFPTAGDFVRIQYNPQGDSLITATLPRRSLFSRPDVNVEQWEQTVAANFDYVFVTMSLNQNFNLRRMERYLTTAWQSGAVPVVVLTKLDLCDDPVTFVREAENAALGVTVCAVSAHTGEGMEQLSPFLKPGKTVVLLGSSGVGKSSLINALAGEEQMKVSAVREDDDRGRHTTTHRQMIRLPGGALFIDTPGMRSLGMWDVTDGLADTFADVEEFAARCRFRDCAHGSEPGCAVRAAIASGDLPAERWENYLKLKKEARFSDDKDAYLRKRTEFRRAISMANHQRKNAARKKK